MIGGDRMDPSLNNYAPFYEKHLRRYVGKPIVLVEVGILRGQGLAIWSELFPDGSVIGLDIDLGHFEAERPALIARGAFRAGNVETANYDQLLGTPDDVAKILGGRKADVVIDDGLHSPAAILNTFKSFRPHLADQFTYIVEDNPRTKRILARHTAGLHVDRQGMITAVSSDRISQRHVRAA